MIIRLEALRIRRKLGLWLVRSRRRRCSGVAAEKEPEQASGGDIVGMVLLILPAAELKMEVLKPLCWLWEVMMGVEVGVEESLRSKDCSMRLEL